MIILIINMQEFDDTDVVSSYRENIENKKES